MGVYAVTGGSNGIGAKTISILKQKGHETINIDWKRGDIEADLSLPEGRQKAIDELFSLCPQGLDGLILCAGIPGSRKDLRLILSVNYFGTSATLSITLNCGNSVSLLNKNRSGRPFKQQQRR